MVLLRVKDDQFLYRTKTDATVDATRSELAQIFHFRQKLHSLKIECEELGEYGIAKRPEEQGIDSYAAASVEKGEFYKMDPTGKRNGNGCCPAAKATLMQTLNDAAERTHKSQVERRHETTKAELLEAVDLIRGAVMICYPMGLPEWDPVRLLLENRDNATESVPSTHDSFCQLVFKCGHEEGEMILWFAGKEMRSGNLLKDHVGDKENTTAIVRLTKPNQGAPAREPVIDEETYKGMMSWSYKKQEEQKALAENEDDHYLDSAWANNKSLKQHLNGTSRIRI